SVGAGDPGSRPVLAAIAGRRTIATRNSENGGLCMKSVFWAVARYLPLFVLLACSTRPSHTETGRTSSANAEGAPKTLVIAQLNLTKSFGPWGFASTSGGGASLAEIHTVGLTSEDDNGNIEPRAAARLPSFDDGTMAMRPDGRMEVTWKLRPDVKWHNGTPFTADDVVFSAQVARFAADSSPLSPGLAKSEQVEALDPLTVRVTWPTTF